MKTWLLGLAMRFLPGYKTVIAGIGLLGLGAYEVSEGKLDQGLAHAAEGLGLIGIRAAIVR